MRTVRLASLPLVLAFTATASAQTLAQVSQHSLPSTLNNLSGSTQLLTLGVDEDNEYLVFTDQGGRRVITTSLTGAQQQVLPFTTAHTTVSTIWNGDLFLVDFTSNSSGFDMYRGAVGTSYSTYGSQRAASATFPIDVRAGQLYRTESDAGFSWSNLSEIWVSNVNTPDSFVRQMTIPAPNGIGDFAVDLDTNSLWVLEWLDTNAHIRQHDLDTGVLIEEFQEVGDGKRAGITYYDGHLYYYDWVQNNPTVTVFATPGGAVGCPGGYDAFDFDGIEGDETCIHPTADVHDSAEIEAGALIGPNAIVAARAIVRASAEIGEGGVVSRRADVAGVLGTGVVVGRGAIVEAGASIGQGTMLGFESTVGADAVVGDNSVLGSLTSVGARTAAGDDGGTGTVIIARSAVVSDDAIIGSQTVIGPDAIVGDATLGANVRLRKGATINDDAVIGDDARIGRDSTVGDRADLAQGVRLGANVNVVADACIPVADTVVARGSDVTGGCN